MKLLLGLRAARLMRAEMTVGRALIEFLYIVLPIVLMHRLNSRSEPR